MHVDAGHSSVKRKVAGLKVCTVNDGHRHARGQRLTVRGGGGGAAFVVMCCVVC